MDGALAWIKSILGLSKNAYTCSATPYGLVYSIIAMAVVVLIVSAILWRRPFRRPLVVNLVNG